MRSLPVCSARIRKRLAFERLMTAADVMPERLRRQYLGLLGIEQWLPRDAVDAPDALLEASAERVAAVGAQPASALLPPQPSATLSTAAVAATPSANPGAQAEAAGSTISAAQRAALLAQTQAKTREERTARVSPSAPSADVARENTGAAPTLVERVGCALLRVDDLLLVAAYGSVDAPGLSGSEHEMLARIAAALRKGHVPAAAMEFVWPPRGVRIPGMDTPGAARDALQAQLALQRRNGVRAVAVLGNEMQVLVESAALNSGFGNVIVSPSLAVMQRDADRKSAGWNALKVLQRSAGA